MRMENYVVSDINTYEVSLEDVGGIAQTISENTAPENDPNIAVGPTPDTKVNTTPEIDFIESILEVY